MSIGFWVVLAVVLFVLGNLMGAKPKAHETRLGQLRTLARQHQLHPKLISIPAWLGSNTMIAQYTKVNDQWRLPLTRLKVQDGMWQLVDGSHHHLVGTSVNFGNLSPYMQGLLIKANCVSIFWHDETYIQQFGARDTLAAQKIQHDIESLCQYLTNCANTN